MSEPDPPGFSAQSSAFLALRGEQKSQALLRECFGQLIGRLHDAVHTSVHATNDLFDFSKQVSEREVADFRARRDHWFAEYERTLRMLYVRRIGGTRRSGRRPDPQSAVATFHLLDPLDHDMQVALIHAVKDLLLACGVELVALSHRVALLLGEKWRPDFDNPFDPQYILDAVGSAARATYDAPYVWRALMLRIVTDIKPVLVKVYIAQNRFLADEHVLPEIKAALRSRSPHRPAEDQELLHAFGRLLKSARESGGTIPPVVVVPPLGMFATPNQSSRAPGPGSTPPASPARIAGASLPGQAIRVQLPDHILRQALLVVSGIPAPGGDLTALELADSPDGLPSVDPLMALGTSRAVVSALNRLQRMDLPLAIVRAAPAFGGRKHEAALVPSNLVPYLRTVLVDPLIHEHDAMVMDFVGLLFDYVFRDPSIPESLHSVFERLQVPIVKTAVIDPDFFTRNDHPARHLLDSLAEASIGAAADTAYFRAFDSIAHEVVNELCHYPHLDLSAFVDAAATVNQFIADDRLRTASAVAPDIADAMAAEQRQLGRAQAHALVRDRFAGIDVPPQIRTFAESTWVDYLTLLRQKDIVGDAEYKAACALLDDLLWSLTAKERHAQRRRLAAMIPALVVALRQGCLALGLPRERSADFFEELFRMHVGVLKRTDETLAHSAAVAAQVASVSGTADEQRAHRLPDSKGIYDFVGEMIVGSWIACLGGQREMLRRLWWVSPMRTRYVFTDRAEGRGWVVTPEELAHQLEAGTASVFAEPIPLFDRAASAAFDAVGGISARAAPA